MLWKKLKRFVFGAAQHHPVMQSAYLIYDRDTLVAELHDPRQSDMFWFSFAVTLRVPKPLARMTIYNPGFWADESRIRIVEKQSGMQVAFILSTQHYVDETLAEDGIEQDPALLLEHSPSELLLRGPYLLLT